MAITAVVIGAGVYGVMVLVMGVKEARGMLNTVGQYMRGKAG